MELEELFPNRIVHCLGRVGIHTLDELRDRFAEIDPYDSLRYRTIGKTTYDHIEYILKVELP